MKDPLIKAVVFDMDGVLYDTEKVAYTCWKEEADRLGLSNIEYVHRGACGLNHTDGSAWLKKNYGQDFDAEGFMKRCGRNMQEKLRREGLPVKEGAREIVYWLKEKKIPSWAIPNEEEIEVRKEKRRKIAEADAAAEEEVRRVVKRKKEPLFDVRKVIWTVIIADLIFVVFLLFYFFLF